MNDGFAGPGVAEFFAGESFNRIGVIPQFINLGLELFGVGLLNLKLGLQPQNVRAHPLVLLQERKIIHANEQGKGDHDQRDRGLGQFAPDTEVYIHKAS